METRGENGVTHEGPVYDGVQYDGVQESVRNVSDAWRWSWVRIVRKARGSALAWTFVCLAVLVAGAVPFLIATWNMGWEDGLKQICRFVVVFGYGMGVSVLAKKVANSLCGPFPGAPSRQGGSEQS